MVCDTKSLFQAIAARIVQKRRERNWSQRELAERSRVSRRMIGLIEGGESNVSLATLGCLAAALGVPCSQRLGGGEPQPPGRG